jgi:hypothetical protein
MLRASIGTGIGSATRICWKDGVGMKAGIGSYAGICLDDGIGSDAGIFSESGTGA